MLSHGLLLEEDVRGARRKQPQTEQTPKGYTVPVPRRDEFFGNLEKAREPEPDEDSKKGSPPAAAGS